MLSSFLRARIVLQDVVVGSDVQSVARPHHPRIFSVKVIPTDKTDSHPYVSQVSEL